MDRALAALLGNRIQETPTRVTTAGMDPGTAAIVASRQGVQLRITTGSWWDDLFPNDPWKNFPDYWGQGGLARKYGMHERISLCRERVYKYAAKLPPQEVSNFEQLYQEWMAFAWMHEPTYEAPQKLEAFEVKISYWENKLNALESGKQDSAIWPYVLGGIVGLGVVALVAKK